MNQQLQRIQEKLAQLKVFDAKNQLFGAQRHQYQLNPPLSMDAIRQFEAQYHVILPLEYVSFLTELGNGGAGPFYGLEPFERAIFVDLDYPNPTNLLAPNLPFPHHQAWNEVFVPTCDEEEDEAEFERQYFEFHRHQMDGVLAISNFGCGVSINLVVNGTEYGYIWTDDRGNDGGIYPSHELENLEKVTFLDWYELWLDNSLQEIAEKLDRQQPIENTTSSVHSQSALSNQDVKNKPWWKFW